MEAVQNSGEFDSRPKRLRLFASQLQWRMILVRLVVNGLTLLAIAGLVPDIYFVDRSLLNILLMAAVLGLLNAFVKPVVQFLTLPFIFTTYGFAIVLINTIMLLLLDLIFERIFYVDDIFVALLGGLVMGIFSSFLESLFGLTLPIVDRPNLAQDTAGTSAGASRAITNHLFDEMAGDETLPPEEDGEDAESRPADTPAEPAETTATEAMPVSDDEPAMTGAEDDDLADEQPGDKQ